MGYGFDMAMEDMAWCEMYGCVVLAEYQSIIDILATCGRISDRCPAGKFVRIEQHVFVCDGYSKGY